MTRLQPALQTAIVNTMHLHYPGETLSIGTPTPNNAVYLLDEQMQPVKIGNAGIIWVGGVGVARGYLNLPIKTGERYKLNPFLDDGCVFRYVLSWDSVNLLYQFIDVQHWGPGVSARYLSP